MAANKVKQHRAYRDVAIHRIIDIYTIANNAREDDSLLTSLKMRMLNLETIYQEFNTHHNNILQYLSVQEEVELDPEENICHDIDQKYFAIKSIHYELIEKYNTTDEPICNKPSNVKLPKLNVPMFNGNLKAWPTFIDLFKSLIHNNKSLTDTEKFQYLLSVLSGEALTLIKNIPLSNDNYLIAFDNILKRYQNTRLLATYYWEEIISAPKLSSESPRTLRNLLDVFSDNLAALKNLNFPVEHWDFILFNIMSKKLDSETLKRFELHHGSSDIPTYKNLYNFLYKQCVAFDSIALVKPQRFHSNTQYKNQNTSHKFNSPSTLVVNTQNNHCPVCKSEHTIYVCPMFSSKSPKERYNLVKQNRWCTNCLGFKHSSKKCDSNASCRKCKGKHHTLLHFENNLESSSIVAPTQDVSQTFSNHGPQPVASTSQINSLANVLPTSPHTAMVLLSTAHVEVLDSLGNYQTVRILLDSASQANFITQNCVNKLGLSRYKTSLSIHGLGQMSSVASRGVTCTLRPKGHLEPIFTLDAVVLPRICPNMPTTNIPVNQWSHIANLNLADPHFNISGPIDMLLGADIFPLVLKQGHLTGHGNEPTALNTIFGWILMGKITYESPPLINSFLTSLEASLDFTLKRFWELEEIPQKITISPEDKICEEIFKNTYTRDNSGRFTVSLPFQGPEPVFSDTRSQALRRFYSLERRLLQNSSLYLEYSNFMKEYLLNGHMEAVGNSTIPNKNYYIPHHCVFNPNSSTTKLRVVFDASAKSQQGPSLNDTLLVGEKLQNDIITILLNFRLHPFVFTADIKQMYRQISITENHRDYQRIIWRFSPSEPVQDFRLTTVTYGVSSAPFLAIRSLIELANVEKVHFPHASQVLTTDVYVDDVVTGGKTLSETKALQRQLIALLNKGGFQLRKWASNDPALLEGFPDSDCQQTSLAFNSNSDTIIKILGLQWQPSLDSFSYEVSPIDRPCTKRTILSELARIFDPLGFLAPLSFFAKHLIQHLWSLGLEWDQTPPPNIVDRWTQYKKELPNISLISIPRQLVSTKYLSCEMHGFSDSSESGFSAVVYFRFVIPDQNIQLRLICAKSKVAPLKRISLPRLELCGAVLLSNLMDFVLKTYSTKFLFNQIFAWTDSMVVLSWVKSSPHRWKTFVSNRVSHIQDKVSPNFWHHVRSHDNPADCASRGLMPSELVNHSLWWAGPPWLRSPQSNWPNTQLITPSDSLEEEKKLTLTSFVSLDYIDILLDKFSSLSKIKRIIAYSLRFIYNTKNVKKNRKSQPFTQHELHNALLVLVKRVQHIVFREEISNLEHRTPIAKSLRKLNPFIGEDGLLRVGGRLTLSGLSYDRKHPAILPRQHRLTELVIESTHRENLHPGLQTLHFLLAQHFWILSPRRAIRHTLSKCYKCFKVKPTPLEPPMGNLPSARISQIKPFQCVGVDYSGAYNITLGKNRGIKSQKAYICLFVCFATKAIHLELASDLSTEAFLAALRRFIARRGRCVRIFSDCGTNFVGANKILSQCMEHATALEKIDWSFNPPSAPHFGGLWESGIKSVKSHLIRIIGEQILTYEEFYTVLVQVEAILNSRPLCQLSSDPNDLSVLTPGHFLSLEPLTAIPDPDLTHLNLNHLKRWQLLQRFHQDFWKRWHNEYLHTLQQRNKWNNPEKIIEPGTLVLIKNDLLPPLQWRIGRIEKIHPGSDGISRVATLKTTQGSLQRPLIKLCPLPSQ